MKKVLITITSLFFYFSSFSQQGYWRTNESEVKIYFKDSLQPEKLSHLNLSGEIYQNYAIVYAVPEEIHKIEQLGLQYEILKPDLNAYFFNFWNKDVPTGYYEYQEIIDIADSLATHFPDICQKIVIGSSLGDRQLAVLKISDNVATDENEPEIMFDAGIHGDEIGGPENIIRFARDLCLDYGTIQQITDLVNTREIWLYLMVNPDGRENMSRYNNNGVDLNRDWGYMWDDFGDSPSAFSQQESKLLRNFVFDHQFVVHTTYHSGTEFVSFPWSYRASQCPDFSHINYLAALYSSESGYSSLPYGQGYSGMYAINGSTKDANYGIQGSVSWSIEISTEKQPPASQVNYYYTINKPSMLALVEYSGYGLEGTVTDAITGEPIPAIILVNNYFQTYNDPLIGDYHKYVLPGTYSIKVIANGYDSQTINNVVVTEGNSTVTDFQLQPSSGQFVYKLWTCIIPGNNEADEGNTVAVSGAPDNINYSIGKSGTMVIDMQFPVIDGPGYDIRIYEGDATPETYNCSIGETPDGPWTLIGTGTGTTDFDFMGLQTEAQFIKIEDDGSGNQTEANAGFDFDAAEALEHVSGVYLSVTDYYIDDSMSGNNDGILDPGETADLVVTVRNNGDITATDVLSTISSGDTYLTLISSSSNLGNFDQFQTAQGIFTLQADPSTPEGHSALIDIDLSSNSGTYTQSSTISIVIGFVPEYCAASGGCDEYIADVVIGTINNSSVCSGYYDYTDISTDVNLGNTYPLTVTVGNPYSSDQLAAYVDWNYDGDFVDAGETFPLTWNSPTATGNIVVPEGITPRPVTMRIRLTYSSIPTPCGTTSYGEVEDYSLNVLSDITQGGTLSAPNSLLCIGSSTGNIILTNNSGTITDWEKRLDGGNWTSIGYTGSTWSEIPSAPGTWEYRVEVDEGAAYSNSVSVDVRQNPGASFTYESNNQEISFTNTSTDALSYDWDFGDGNNSTIENPVHTYEATGTYTVALTASNDICEDAVYSEGIAVNFVGIEEVGSNVKILPNPTNGLFIIDTGNIHSKETNVSIYDISGQILYQKNATDQWIEVDMSHHAKGIYIIRLFTGDSVIYCKVDIR